MFTQILAAANLFGETAGFRARIAKALTPLLCFAAAALGQPPSISAITNAADYSFTIAPGSLATIFGTALAPSEALAPTLPLATVLNKVTVSVNGRLAPVYYVKSTQINFQLPYETATGVAIIQVSNNGQLSNSAQVLVVSSAPGIFQYGQNLGVIQNQDITLNTSSNPAANGSIITVYLTGIGATTPAVSDGAASPFSPPATTSLPVTATIGDQNAAVMFLGLTPGSIGLAQANIQVPQLSTGAYPLTITLNGHPSTSVLVSVAGSAGGFQVTNILSLAGSVSLPNGVGITAAQGISGLLGGSLAMFGNYLYICGPPSIHVVDVTNVASPKVLNEFGNQDLNNRGAGCATDLAFFPGPFLFEVVYGPPSSILLYDIFTPDRPIKKSQSNAPFPITAVTLAGSFGFVDERLLTYSAALGYQVQGLTGNVGAIQFSNISNPPVISTLSFNPAQPATNMANAKGEMVLDYRGVLYIASMNASTGTGALDFFDVSSYLTLGGSPSIQALGEIQIPGTVLTNGVALSDNELLVTGTTLGLLNPGYLLPNGLPDFPATGNLTVTMFNVANPRSPVMQGNIVVTSLQPNEAGCPAAALGGGFFALSCPAPDLLRTGPGVNNSLVIVDARQPQNPKAYTYGTVQGLGGLLVANGYLYAATTTGANIYKIQLPQSQ